MNKKLLFFKKTAALLLCAVLLLPCSACFNSPEAKNPAMIPDRLQTARILKPVMKPSIDYVNRLFTETVTTDTITLHSYMEHPSDFGIDNYEVTLGRYDLAGLDNTSDITGKLTALKALTAQRCPQNSRLPTMNCLFTCKMNWNSRIYSFSRPAYAQRPVFTYNFR